MSDKHNWLLLLERILWDELMNYEYSKYNWDFT